MDATTTTETEMATLIADRKILAENLYYSDSSAFPGSAAWRESNAAGKALTAFDEAHPEVIKTIRATQAAADLERYGDYID